MFERYTQQARRALFFARCEASQLGSTVMDTEHLLLGLLREDKGLTGLLFDRSGVSREDIRRELEERSTFREKVSTSVEIPFSQQATRTLQFACEEADRLSHNHIGTEHLLLGLLREERSAAAAVLFERGMRGDAVRMEIVRLLNERATAAIEMDSDTHFADGLNVEPEVPRERLWHSDWTIRFRDGGCWFQREGDPLEGPYCVRCWNTKRRWVRMVSDAPGAVRCESCDNRVDS